MPHTFNQEPEEQRERNAQGRRLRLQAQAVLNRDHDALALAAQQRNTAIVRGGIKKKSLAKHEESAPEFANAKPLQKMGFSLFVLGAIAVILLNFFLINASVNYLANIAFGNADLTSDPWQVQVATVILPVVLLIVELCIAIGRREAYLNQTDEQVEVETNGWDWSVKRWDVAGMVMICVTPLMIIGSMLAAPNWSDAYNLVTSLGMIVLAGVTDALIIFGGEQMYRSQAFVFFQVSYWGLERRINYFDAQRRKADRQIESTWRHYTQVLNRHNDRYPENPLSVGPFSQMTTTQVNESIGQNPPAINTGQNNQPGNNEPDAEPPTAGVPRPTPPNGGNDGDAAEADYYEELRREQVRRHEREVQPD